VGHESTTRDIKLPLEVLSPSC